MIGKTVRLYYIDPLGTRDWQERNSAGPTSPSP
jgi:hypothetical protein